MAPVIGDLWWFRYVTPRLPKKDRKPASELDLRRRKPYRRAYGL